MQVFGDTYPQVTGTVNKLQCLAMEGILGADRLSGSVNVHNLIFFGLKSMSQVRSHSCKVSRSF